LVIEQNHYEWVRVLPGEQGNQTGRESASSPFKAYIKPFLGGGFQISPSAFAGPLPID
jgi:hypothetical protein